MQGFLVVVIAVAYVTLLFAIASLGDRWSSRRGPERTRPYIYALSLAIYCTSWTFFGSVGLATERGLEFLAIYIGPLLVFIFGFPLLGRIIRLAKAEKITSIADFLGARYGKSFAVASTATLIAVIGIVPYIALQLRAIAGSVSLMVEHYNGAPLSFDPFVGDISLIIALLLALFAILFGTRHADATEHQDGLVLAVAVESVVKLAAFLAVGIFVFFFLFDSPQGLLAALAFYIWSTDLPRKVSEHMRVLYTFFLRKWYFDEIFHFLFVRPAFWIGGFFWKKGDEGTIDRFGPDGAAALVAGGNRLTARLQSGYLYTYALVMLLGLAAATTWAMTR